MKHTTIILIALLITCTLTKVSARDNVVILRNGNNGAHFLVPNPAEIPDLYFDDEALSLTVDGSGAVCYYEVTITSATTSLTFLYTVVDGDYDTIDISYLPAGDTYVITLTTPGGTEYEGSIAL